MVAYSFQRRFGSPIRLGLVPGPAGKGAKRHTVRGDRRRHAREGEEIQLYHGMRTKDCELIGKARCTETQGITIHFRKRRSSDWLRCARFGKIDRPDGLDRFARADGFTDWADLRAFWADQHPGVRDFAGVIIFWEPLPTAAA